LLYFALIEIRSAVIAGDLKRAETLADVFHNIPLALDKEERDGSDGTRTLELVRIRADQRGAGSWVDNALEHNVTEKLG
jgi:hypothetical protein